MLSSKWTGHCCPCGAINFHGYITLPCLPVSPQPSHSFSLPAMFLACLSLLSALPFALAAPTYCSVKPTQASASPPSSTSTSALPATTSSAATSSPGNTSTGAGTNGIHMGWYPDWISGYSVSDIVWSNYTHMALFTSALRSPLLHPHIDPVCTAPSPLLTAPSKSLSATIQ